MFLFFRNLTNRLFKFYKIDRNAGDLDISGAKKIKKKLTANLIIAFF
jgi:hypothetical protein